jgi:hypothetical protein
MTATLPQDTTTDRQDATATGPATDTAPGTATTGTVD